MVFVGEDKNFTVLQSQLRLSTSRIIKIDHLILPKETQNDNKITLKKTVSMY